MALREWLIKKLEKRAVLANARRGTWLYNALVGNYKTTAGVSVTPQSAMTYNAIYAAVRVIAETIASLPLMVYYRDNGSKRLALWNRIYNLLHDQPNEYMSAMSFRETLSMHLLLWGNAYAEIEHNAAGEVIALWPLLPNKMNVRSENGKLDYVYKFNEAEQKIYLPGQILHIPGLAFDGLIGYSPIGLARQTIGLGLATEKFGSQFFGNGSRLSGMLEHPGTLTENAENLLRKSLRAQSTGDNALGIGILQEGMKWTQIGVPPDDAQFIQTRKFQVTEIARIYRIPPHLLADLDKASFSNIEHQSIEFVVHCIRPWLVRWEQELNRKLFNLKERKYFAEHKVDGLLRGDIKSRYDAYRVGRNWGWLSANDVRRLENMNPIEGGDDYLVPLNMIPAGRAGIDLKNNHKRLLRGLLGRLVREEVSALTKAKDDEQKINTFYHDFRNKIKTVLEPAISAYVSAVDKSKLLIVDEYVGKIADEFRANGDDFDKRINDYPALLAGRIIGDFGDAAAETEK